MEDWQGKFDISKMTDTINSTKTTCFTESVFLSRSLVALSEAVDVNGKPVLDVDQARHFEKEVCRMKCTYLYVLLQTLPV